MKKIITLEQAIGAAIKHFRERAGQTQQDLADNVGVNKSWISQLEHGKTTISIRRVYEIAEALNINAKELLP